MIKITLFVLQVAYIPNSWRLKLIAGFGFGKEGFLQGDKTKTV
ncbi:MAG: hypothetical protein V4620_13365 [Bacteroidota bacterium]